MTEDDWLSSDDAAAMLRAVQGTISDRKRRLFTCGCFRAVWKSLTLKRVRDAVKMTELRAEGLTSDTALDLAHRARTVAFAGMVNRATRANWRDPAYVVKIHRMALATNAAHAGPFQMKLMDGLSGPEDEYLRSVSPIFLRCIFGNPFRPVAFDPRWRTADVLGLARGIYDDRAFDRLPLLADALMDAGCDEDQLLAHCRSEGPHVRGCWAVDLVLDKA